MISFVTFIHLPFSNVYLVDVDAHDSIHVATWSTCVQVRGQCTMYLEKRSCQLFYYCVHMALPNDTAIQTRCLRSYVSFYVRCSVPGPGPGSFSMAPTIARPAGCMRVHCRLFVVGFSDVHARGTSFFGTASCMSCFGYFVSWPGLFRFGAAETSFRGILLNDR